MVGTAYYLTIWPPLTVNLQSIWKKKKNEKMNGQKEIHRVFFSWEPSGVCTHGCMIVCVLIEKYTQFYYVRNNIEKRVQLLWGLSKWI
jgi:hypothetical protein